MKNNPSCKEFKLLSIYRLLLSSWLSGQTAVCWRDVCRQWGSGYLWLLYTRILLHSKYYDSRILPHGILLSSWRYFWHCPAMCCWNVQQFDREISSVRLCLLHTWVNSFSLIKIRMLNVPLDLFRKLGCQLFNLISLSLLRKQKKINY